MRWAAGPLNPKSIFNRNSEETNSLRTMFKNSCAYMSWSNADLAKKPSHSARGFIF